MKKVVVLASFLALSIGIGALNWLALAYCINYTGRIPLFFA